MKLLTKNSTEPNSIPIASPPKILIPEIVEEAHNKDLLTATHSLSHLDEGRDIYIDTPELFKGFLYREEQGEDS